MPTRLLLTVLVGFVATDLRAAGNDTPELSAKEMAARLTSNQEGSSVVRLKMEVKDSADGPAKADFQLLIKQRRTAEATDLVYQVLFRESARARLSSCARAPGTRRVASCSSPPANPKPSKPRR